MKIIKGNPPSIVLSDGMTNPTVPLVGANVLLWNGTTWDRAFAATLFDLDTGGGTERVVGVNLRTSASGGSTEHGVAASPLQVSLANTADNAIPVRSALYTIKSVAIDINVGVASDGTQRVILASDNPRSSKDFAYQTDTFTAVTPATVIDVTINPMKNFTIQTVATGAVTSWTITIEGSIDGTNYFIMGTSTNVVLNISVANTPVRYFRANCTAIVLGAGTNVKSYILGTT